MCNVGVCADAREGLEGWWWSAASKMCLDRVCCFRGSHDRANSRRICFRRSASSQHKRRRAPDTLHDSTQAYLICLRLAHTLDSRVGAEETTETAIILCSNGGCDWSSCLSLYRGSRREMRCGFDSSSAQDPYAVAVSDPDIENRGCGGRGKKTMQRFLAAVLRACAPSRCAACRAAPKKRTSTQQSNPQTQPASPPLNTR